MIGNEWHDIHRRWQQMTGGPDVTVACWAGVFVERSGRFGQLLKRTYFERPDAPPTNSPKRPSMLNPIHALPADAALVVRVEAASTLAAHLTGRTIPSSGAGGPQTARWIRAYMDNEQVTVNRLRDLTGCDARTIKKMLNAEPVRQGTVEKFFRALRVPASRFPSD